MWGGGANRFNTVTAPHHQGKLHDKHVVIRCRPLPPVTPHTTRVSCMINTLSYGVGPSHPSRPHTTRVSCMINTLSYGVGPSHPSPPHHQGKLHDKHVVIRCRPLPPVTPHTTRVSCMINTLSYGVGPSHPSPPTPPG